MALKDLEQHWKELIVEKRPSWKAYVAHGFLRLLSWPYKGAMLLRNWAFDQGYRPTQRIPDALVISVGNLVTGGTGKTPVILRLAEELADLKLAVLSRGYRSKAETEPKPTFLSRGQGPRLSSDHCGDEPFLISSRLPDLFVIVGRDRCQAAEMAVGAGCRVLLLDDGMQHRRLSRDVDIVVLDAKDPFGQGYHLPRGFLREDPRALSRAGLIIINHVRDKQHFDRIAKQVSSLSSSPIIGTQLRCTNLETLDGKHLPSLKGTKVGIFCGIGHPEKFRHTIEGLGGEVVAELFSSDHRLPPPKAFKAFTNSCLNQGAQLLVCTEKDKVKLDPPQECPLPIAWLKVGINIIAGFDAWNHFIQEIRERA